MKVKKTNLYLISAIIFFSLVAISMFVFYNSLTSNNDKVQPTQETKGDGNMVNAVIETNYGTIKVALNKAKAPISTQNFVDYTKAGFYDGTVFHRVIPGFMVQGGGFTPDGKQKATQAQIKNEAKNGLTNKRGTLAMARTNVVDSATSQFFINLVDNDFLNYQSDSSYGYAVFGEVVSGMDVVDKIAQVQTSSRGPYDDWPVKDVIMTKVTIE